MFYTNLRFNKFLKVIFKFFIINFAIVLNYKFKFRLVYTDFTPCYSILFINYFKLNNFCKIFSFIILLFYKLIFFIIHYHKKVNLYNLVQILLL